MGRTGAKRLTLAIIIVAILARLPFLTSPGHKADQEQFFFWAFLAADHGLPTAYDQYHAPTGEIRRWSNYPPGYLCVLWAVAKFYPVVTGRPYDESAVRDLSNGGGSREAIIGYALFKLPGALADVATAALLFIFLRRRNSPIFAAIVAFLYAVHPAVLHNSVIWGQVDSVHTVLMLISLEAAATRRYLPMTAAATLAVLIKAQSLMLAPLWLMVMIQRNVHGMPNLGTTADQTRIALRRCAACMFMAIGIMVVVSLPFGSHIGGIRDAYFKAVGFYPYVHLNGFSLWFLANPLSQVAESFAPYARDDQAILPGITPRSIGLAALVLSWLWICYLLAKFRCSTQILAWTARVLPLAFFLLPTQIHERYIFPALTLWTWSLGQKRAGWIGWLVLSACCWLNAVWVYPGPNGGTLDRLFASNLHHESLGKTIGIACALILAALWIIEMANARRYGDESKSANPNRPPDSLGVGST